jgi:hypothetical protein
MNRMKSISHYYHEFPYTLTESERRQMLAWPIYLLHSLLLFHFDTDIKIVRIVNNIRPYTISEVPSSPGQGVTYKNGKPIISPIQKNRFPTVLFLFIIGILPTAIIGSCTIYSSAVAPSRMNWWRIAHLHEEQVRSDLFRDDGHDEFVAACTQEKSDECS